jgi:hypothetical protein
VIDPPADGELNSQDQFERSLEIALGKKVRQDERCACELWAALSNVTWRHPKHADADYSWREAGSLVASIRRDQSIYLDWYMSATAGVVAFWIRKAMAAEGWLPDAK